MELESQRWRRVACREWPALPPGATVRSQPKLSLRAMSRSVAIQQQVSVLMSVTPITTRKHEDIPSHGSNGDHMNVQGLCRTSPASPWLWHSGEMTTFHQLQHSGPVPHTSTRESRPCTSPGQHSRANPCGGVPGELAPRV